MVSALRNTIFVASKTATSDVAFPIVAPGSDEGNTILSSINIHCYTNDMQYGTGSLTSGIIRANAVVWFDGTIRVSDLWFKNNGAGANGQIVVVGIVK